MNLESQNQDPIFDEIVKDFGFIPNLAKEMALSPAVLKFYFKGMKFLADSVFTKKEIWLIRLHIATYNDSKYCQSAHHFQLLQLDPKDPDIQRILEKKEPQSDRAKALTLATHLLIVKKGCLTSKITQELENRGIDRRQTFEIIGIIASETLANYIDHITAPKVDEQFIPPA